MALTSQTQLVRSHDIYHGLPVFPDEPAYKNLTAIVTGANGISGQHMLRVLAQAPERWTKIYALSRRPPPDYLLKSLGPQVEIVKHIALDFFTSPEEMGKTLREHGVKADHVFYFAYTQPPQKVGEKQWSNAQEMADQNTDMLVRFMKACDVADVKPRRFMLQTGAKHYGLHRGPCLNPQYEDDPRMTGEPNFYYPQEDALKEYCSTHDCQWNVVRPSFIMGAVGDNLLNYLYGLGIYAAVQAHLKRPVHFPGDLDMWDATYVQSSAFMNAYLEEWAALDPKTGNEAFNVADDSLFSFGRFWPLLGKWYGTTHTPPETDEAKYNTVGLGIEPPPRGFGKEATFSTSFSLAEWAKKPEVISAWKELASKYDIKSSPFDEPEKSFALADGSMMWPWGIQLSMSKARKLGWHGFVDSYESAFRVFQEFAEFKLVPPMAMDAWEQPY